MKHSRPELVEIAKTHLSHLSPKEQVEWVEHYTSSHPGFHKHATPPEKVIVPKVEGQDTPSYPIIISVIGLLLIIFFLCFLLARGSKAEPRPHVSINKVTENGSFHLEVDPSFQDIQQIFSFDPSNNLKVNCITGCSASAGFTDNTVFTVGSSTINPLGAYFTSGADPSISTGNSGRIRMDTHSYLFVDCVVGCSGGATTPSDAFANPSTAGLSFDLLAGWNGATWDRLQVDGSKFLKVNCSVGCSGGSTTPSDAFANPSTAGLDFSLLAGWNGATWDRLKSSTTNGLQVDVTRVQGTVTVAGTVNTTPPSNASTNVAQWASQTLGSMANYGTSPGAVLVPGVNAFITNIPAVSQSGTWTVQPGNTANTTAWKVDGSAVTQPVSGTVTTTPPSNASTNVAQWASSNLGAMANYGTSPGAVLVPGVNAFITNTPAVTLASTTITGTVAATQSGTWTDRIVGNTGVALDVATGAAPPANALLKAGLGSGATGGLLLGEPVADTYKSINISTATTTLLVTGVAGRQVRISALNLITAAANNVALIEGTGATCGTGSAGMAGGTTAASGWNLSANGGMAFGTGIGTVIQTVTTGDSVCAVTSAATQLSGGLMYAIY